MTPEQAILGYLLRERARDGGSRKEVIEGVGYHAYKNSGEPFSPLAAKAASGAAKDLARALMATPEPEGRGA